MLPGIAKTAGVTAILGTTGLLHRGSPARARGAKVVPGHSADVRLVRRWKLLAANASPCARRQSCALRHCRKARAPAGRIRDGCSLQICGYAPGASSSPGLLPAPGKLNRAVGSQPAIGPGQAFTRVNE